MSGKQRLPGGEARKASQRNKLRAGSRPTMISPTWRGGEAVRWKGRAGVFRRDVDRGGCGQELASRKRRAARRNDGGNEGGNARNFHTLHFPTHASTGPVLVTGFDQ